MQAEEILKLARHLAAVSDRLEAIVEAANDARAEIHAIITAPTPAGAPAVEERCICKQALPWLAMMDPNCPVHRHWIVSLAPAAGDCTFCGGGGVVNSIDQPGMGKVGPCPKCRPAPAAGAATLGSVVERIRSVLEDWVVPVNIDNLAKEIAAALAQGGKAGE